MSEDDGVPLETNKFARFHSKAVPPIFIYSYLERLTVYTALSSPILLSMMIYVERLCDANPMFKISDLTVHRILLACFTVATKKLSDCSWTNREYAHIGGVRASEMALLELELLGYLRWDIVLQTDQLARTYSSLAKYNGRY